MSSATTTVWKGGVRMIRIDKSELCLEPQVYIAVGLTEFDTFIVRTGQGEAEARKELEDALRPLEELNAT